MRHDYTHISILLDRTGSMESIRDDTIGGFNAFVADQKSQPGFGTLTLVQFDQQDPYEVIHHFKPIELVPLLTRDTYVPRAATPLLDALGRGINDVEQSISALKEENRPEKIVFAVVTDGRENCSREFRKEQIERMIREKKEQNAWQFAFLSADLAAFRDGQDVGFSKDASLQFTKDRRGTWASWNSLSHGITDYRTGANLDIRFAKEDRQHPSDPAKSEQ